MNEFIFAVQLALIILFSLVSLRLGKEALVSYICILLLASNVFVLKQIRFLGLQATCSDTLMIGSLIGLNLLREFFDREIAKKTTYICFFLMLFLVVSSQLHLLYIPIPQDTSQEAYATIFSYSPRLFFASLIVFFLVQQIDMFLYTRVKKYFPKLNFTFRNYCILLISQLIDTILYTFLGLYGLIESVFDVICISFILKVLIIFCLTPITAFSKRFAPKAAQEPVQ